MFDKLDQVRKEWSNNKPVVISNSNQHAFFVIPSQLVFSSSFELFKKFGSTRIYKILGHNYFRELKLPLISSLYKGVASRYPVLHLLEDHGNHPIDNQSITITCKLNEKRITNKHLADAVRNFGDVLENRSDRVISETDLLSKFTNLFITPGEITLVKGKYELLKTSNHINELALALCEIGSYPLNVITVPILDEDGGYVHLQEGSSKWNNLLVIEASLIINLWRSIKKISRDEITYLT